MSFIGGFGMIFHLGFFQGDIILASFLAWERAPNSTNLTFQKPFVWSGNLGDQALLGLKIIRSVLHG
jgi:hypothetical protein